MSGSINADAESETQILGLRKRGGERRVYTEGELRDDLRFYFMNPLEKWRARKKFPFKLIIQLIKIVLVTLQLVLFSRYRYSHVNYVEDMQTTLRSIFLRDWGPERESVVYPPGQGPLSIYTKTDFFSYLEHAVNAYSSVNDAIGPFSYTNSNGTIAPLELCLSSFKKGTAFGFNESYIFDSAIVKNCLKIIPSDDINPEPNASWPKEKVPSGNFRAVPFLEDNDMSISFDALVKVELIFYLKTVNFRADTPLQVPECYKLKGLVLFDNADHDGQMIISLYLTPEKLVCRGETSYVDHGIEAEVGRAVLNIVIMLFCLCSFILCIRAIVRAQKLKCETMLFFENEMDEKLEWSDQLEFLNLWYIMIIVNDFLIIIGSLFKQLIETRRIEGDLWNVCAVMLGTGNLLVWIGVLRYLGLFQKYNILILTLKRALPNVMRFLLCVLLIYFGFVLCGWLVLGPYHIKFATIYKTAECLFALMNGDDMFASFWVLREESPLVFWYLRIYLYSFITLFIYCILSLFIGIILDAYETVKMFYEEGFPQSKLEKFIYASEEDGHIGMAAETSWGHCCHRLLSRLSSSRKRISRSESARSGSEEVTLVT